MVIELSFSGPNIKSLSLRPGGIVKIYGNDLRFSSVNRKRAILQGVVISIWVDKSNLIDIHCSKII